MGKWKSRYGNAYVAFPSVIDDQLEYEVLELTKENGGMK